MARRPQRMPRWAYDAAGSRLTEPPESEQLNGWNTNDRPPAQYFNWMFHYHSAWCDFLRGPSLAKWQSDTLPYDTSELTSASLAVDSATTEGTSLVKRNIIAAVDGGGNAVFTSVRAGNATSWTRRTNFTASGTFWRAFFCGPSGSERFWITVDHASAGVLLTTAANSAVLGGTGNWTSATLPGGTKGVRAVAYDGSAYWAAVARDTILATPNASPTSWTAATLGTSVTGTFRDLVWTGTAFLAVTNQGEVYRAGGGSAAAATWTALSAMPPGAADWRFTVGPDGTVLAWVENLGAAADFYTTDDDGDSWTAVTSSPSVERIKSITFADSVWMAATVEAPYIWQSNDATAWTRLKLPYAGATTVYDVAYSEGSWLAARNAFVEVSARAEDIAAGTWAPDPTTSSLGNAGWLRGRALSETAPTNGQVYAWNSSTSKWAPTTISGGATALADLSDIGTMGEPIAQADNLSEVLTAMGGAAAVRTALDVAQDGATITYTLGGTVTDYTAASDYALTGVTVVSGAPSTRLGDGTSVPHFHVLNRSAIAALARNSDGLRVTHVASNSATHSYPYAAGGATIRIPLARTLGDVQVDLRVAMNLAATPAAGGTDLIETFTGLCRAQPLERDYVLGGVWINSSYPSIGSGTVLEYAYCLAAQAGYRSDDTARDISSSGEGTTGGVSVRDVRVIVRGAVVEVWTCAAGGTLTRRIAYADPELVEGRNDLCVIVSITQNQATPQAGYYAELRSLTITPL